MDNRVLSSLTQPAFRVGILVESQIDIVAAPIGYDSVYFEANTINKIST